MLEFAFEDEEQDFGKMTGFNEGVWDCAFFPE
jgi:hypothetical protein